MSLSAYRWLTLILAIYSFALIDGLMDKIHIRPLQPTITSLSRDESLVYTYGVRKDGNKDTKIYQSIGHFEWEEEKTKYLSVLYPEHWPIKDFFEVTYVQVLLRPLDVAYDVTISGPIDSALITINILAPNTRSLNYEIDIYGYKNE